MECRLRPEFAEVQATAISIPDIVACVKDQYVRHMQGLANNSRWRDVI